MAVQPTEHSPLHNLEEEGELSDQEVNLVTDDTEQMLSEEQSYRETVIGIRSFKGLHHIPDFDYFLIT